MIEVLRRRLEAWGDGEPDIRRRAADEIVIWYPGGPLKAFALKAILERPGVLEFQAVDPDNPWFEAARPALDRWGEARSHATVTLEWTSDGVVIRADTLDELEDFASALPELPPARRLGFQEEDVWDRGIERSTRWRLFLLHADAPVHGAHIAHASATINEYDGTPVVALEFTAAGGEAFADLTEALTGRLLAIVLDGRVMSAPKVLERIPGGRAQITLGAGRAPEELFEEARGLATILRSGGHPATLVPLTEAVTAPGPLEGWRALGPLPFTAQAIALMITLRYGCF